MKSFVRFESEERVDEPDATSLSTQVDGEARAIFDVLAKGRYTTGDISNNAGCILETSSVIATPTLTISAGARLLMASHLGDAGERPYGEVFTLPSDVTVAGGVPAAGEYKLIMARTGVKTTGTNANRVKYDGTVPEKEKVVPIDTKYTRSLEWTVVDYTDAGAVAAAYASGYLAAVFAYKVDAPSAPVALWMPALPQPTVWARFPAGQPNSFAQVLHAVAYLLGELKGVAWDAVVPIALSAAKTYLDKLIAPDLCILRLNAAAEQALPTGGATALAWSVTETDSENMHASPSSELIPVQSGWYELTANIRVESAPADGSIGVRCSNDTLTTLFGGVFYFPVLIGGRYSFHCSGVQWCDAGDVVKLYVDHALGVDLDVYRHSGISLKLVRLTA